MLNFANGATHLGGDVHPVPMVLADFMPSGPFIHVPMDLAIHIRLTLFMC